MSSRDQPLVFECIQDMWTYRHGEPRRVKVDREFHKPGLKEALGVGVVTLPARRHSNQGQSSKKSYEPTVRTACRTNGWGLNEAPQGQAKVTLRIWVCSAHYERLTSGAWNLPDSGFD